MPWHANVETEFDYDNVPDNIRSKVNEIAEDAGRGQLRGSCSLGDHTCYHWNAGRTDRIFGYMTDGDPRNFHFSGYGPHTSRGSSTYNVTTPNTRRTTRLTLT